MAQMLMHASHAHTQGLPGCLPWGMFLTFFNDFLSQQKGLSVPVATMVRSTLFSLNWM